MKHPKYWACFFLVASIVTAALIFWFSAQKGAASQALSDSLTMRLVHVLRPDYKKMSSLARVNYREMLSTIIRKNAHFCEFMLLGFNLMGAMRFGFPRLSDGRCRLRAMALAVAYAVSDELHQLFVSERAARLTDVLIDSVGSLTGTLMMTLCLTILLRLQQLRASRH